MANRNVQAPTSVVITDEAGRNFAQAATVPPVSGVDYGVPVYANLGSAVIPVSAIEVGAANTATGQQALNGTAASIVAARPTRLAVLITNTGAVDVYLGTSSGVTTGTGTLLKGTKGATIGWPGCTTIFGITGGSAAIVTFTDFYN